MRIPLTEEPAVRAIFYDSVDITSYVKRFWETEYNPLHLALGRLEAAVSALDLKETTSLKLTDIIDQRGFLYWHQERQNFAGSIVAGIVHDWTIYPTCRTCVRSRRVDEKSLTVYEYTIYK